MRNTAINKKRTPWIDDLKMITMIGVIIGHVPTCLNDIVSFSFYGFPTLLYMPMFVILSGYCAYNTIDKVDDVGGVFLCIKRNALRLMLPCVTIAFLSFFFGFRWRSLLFTETFWFLTMLFVESTVSLAVFYLVRKLSKKESKSKSFILPVLLFTLLLLFVDRWHVGEMAIYYSVGLTLKKYNFLSNTKEKYQIAVLILTLSILAYVIYMNIYPELLSIENSFYYKSIIDCVTANLLHWWILRHLFAILICCSIIYIFAMVDTHNYNIFSYLGSRTLEIYLIHVFFVFRFKDFYIFSHWYQDLLAESTSFSAIGLALVVFLILVSMSLLLIHFIDKNRYTIFLFSGIKQE